MLKDPLNTTVVGVLRKSPIPTSISSREKAMVVLLYLMVTAIPGAEEGVSGIRSFN